MCALSVPILLSVLALGLTASTLSAPFYETNTRVDRSAIVHLFEWKWLDIARECEFFLAPHGYAAVQISPPTENLVIWLEDRDRPWWERYQVMSYKLVTRSGNEEELQEMCRRCNAVGIRIYADVVINHMTANHPFSFGTAGSTANTFYMNYSKAGFDSDSFHQPQCFIEDYNNATQVRNCEFDGRHDLDHSQPRVRQKIVDMMNHLIDLGVTGFRIDAAKYMWPSELRMIMNSLKPLNYTQYSADIAPNTKPFVYQEVVDFGGDSVSYKEYTDIGRIVDHMYSNRISKAFRGEDDLRSLQNWGPDWGVAEGPISVVFVDSHETQRSLFGQGGLNFKDPKRYKMAVAFMLAFPHGFPRIMSSYDFSNNDQGPPKNEQEIASPEFNARGECIDGYICEHRWKQIASMVGFRNSAGETPVENWWNDGDKKISFSRGDKAFIAFNTGKDSMDAKLQTGLPEGVYCDVISGSLRSNGRCSGKTVNVDRLGLAVIKISPDEDGIVATHVGARMLS